MFCHKCGTELPETSEFCHKCGAKIVEEAASGHDCETTEVYKDVPPQPVNTPAPVVEVGAVEPTIAEDVQYQPSAHTAKSKKDTALHKAAVIGRTFSGGMAILVMLASYLHLRVPLLFNPFIIIGVVSAGLILSALDPKRSIFKKIIELIVGVILVVVVVYYALSSGGTGDKYIQIVKDGTLDAYPQMTVGEAFDGYLDNPKWESGLSEDKQRFVNVKGGILYAEKEAEIVVQFFVNEKDDSFKYNACEINGLPQTNIVVLGLFENIYGIESTNESNQVEQTSPKQAIEATPAPNTLAYDVDELALRLGTRQGSLYEEGAPLYGKYDQCEKINADDKYGVKYGDLTVLGSRALDGDIVQFSTINPKTFQKNGIPLDKNREDLIALLGVAEFDGLEQGTYYMTFLCDGYSLSFKFNDPSEVPYEIIIHY